MRRPDRTRVAAGVLAVEVLAVGALVAVVGAGHRASASEPRPTWSIAAIGSPGPVATASGAVPGGAWTTAGPVPGGADGSEAARAVHAAPPLRLVVDALGIDARVAPYTAAEASGQKDGVTGRPCLVGGVITCISPRSLDDVAWQVGGVAGVAFGSEPGTDAIGTVYLYGHAATGAEAVFDEVGRLAPGDTATVMTANGTLVYRVQRTLDTAKSAFTSLPEAVDQVPGRLLLVSCDHRPGAALVGGGYATGNIVVVLQLEQP